MQSTQTNAVDTQNFIITRLPHYHSAPMVGSCSQQNEVSPDDVTKFVAFLKGYPWPNGRFTEVITAYDDCV